MLGSSQNRCETSSRSVTRALARQEAIRNATRKRIQRHGRAAPTPRRWLPGRRSFLLGVLVLVAVVAVVVKDGAEDATRAHVVNSMAAALGQDFAFDDIDLSNLVGGQLSIGDLSWGGGATQDPLLEIGKVWLGFDTEEIMRGEAPRVSVVELYGVELHLFRDGNGVLNMVRALQDRAESSLGGAETPGALPDLVRIRKGKLELMDEHMMKEPIIVSSIDLELRRDDADPDLRQLSGEVHDGVWGNWTLSGTVTESDAGMRIEELHVGITDLGITDAIERHLDGGLLAYWRALEPGGRVQDIDITMSRDESDRLAVRIGVDTNDLRLALVEAALGSTIGEIALEVLLDGDAAELSLVATAAGGGVQPGLLSVRGAFPRGTGENGQLDLELADLELTGRLQELVPQLLALRSKLAPDDDPEARAAADESLIAKLARLDLRGRMSLQAHLDLVGMDGRPEFTGGVDLRDASLVVPGILDPVVADQINGSLAFAGGDVWADTDEVMTARIDGVPARLVSATWTDAFRRDQRAYELVVELPAISVQDSPALMRLEQAIARKSAAGADSRFLQRLRESDLQGDFDLAVTVRGGGPSTPRTTEMQIESTEGLQLVHRGLPCPVMLSGGTVLISRAAPADEQDSSRGAVEITDLRATTPFGALTGSAAVRAGRGAQLTVDCAELALAPELHAHAPGWAVRAWDALRMDGTLGLTTTLHWQDGGFAAQVAARDAHLRPLGVDLVHVAGSAHWDGHALTMKDFSGEGLGGRIEVTSGRLVREGDGPHLDLRFAGRRLDLRHPTLVRMIGGPDAAGGLRPGGAADVAGTLALQRWDRDTLRLESDLRIPRLELHGRHVDDVQARVLVDRRIISLEQIRAQLHGGKLAGAARVALGASFRPYEGVVQVVGVRLDQLVAEFIEEPDARISGVLDGELAFSGVLGSLEGLSGRGSLRTHSGWLYEMPERLARMDGRHAAQPAAARAHGGTVALPAGSRGGGGSFRNASAEFSLCGPQVTLLSSSVGGSQVALHGFGDLRLSGALNLDVLLGRVGSRDLAAARRDAPVGFRISGSFHDPHIDMQLLPGLGGLFDDLGHVLGSDLEGPRSQELQAGR